MNTQEETSHEPLNKENNNINSNDVEAQNDNEEKPLKSLKDQAINLFFQSLPTIIFMIFMASTDNISIHFLKEKNDNIAISALGLGYNIINIISIQLLMSLAEGFVSKLSSAHAIKDHKLLGILFHRGLIFHLIIVMFGCVLAFFTKDILVTLNFNEDLAIETQKFTVWSIPAQIALVFSLGFTAYLNCKQDFITPVIFELISIISFYPVCYYLIDVLDLGIVGAALSLDILIILPPIGEFIYITVKQPIPGAWFCLTSRSFKHIFEIVKYEVTVGGIMYVEMIALSLISFVGGELDLMDYTAFISVSVLLFWYRAIPLGVVQVLTPSFTDAICNTQKGQEHVMAKRTVNSSIIISLSGAFLLELASIFFGEEIAGFMNNDPVIKDKILELMRLLEIALPFIFTLEAHSCIIRVIGRGKEAFWVSFITIYLIALPLSYYLAIPCGHGAFGLLLGQMIGEFFQFLGYEYYYWSMDWSKCADYVMGKLEEDQMNLSKSFQADIQEEKQEIEKEAKGNLLDEEEGSNYVPMNNNIDEQDKTKNNEQNQLM